MKQEISKLYKEIINYLNEEGRDSEDVEVMKIVEKVQCILDNVVGINFSAFSQFFMVYNSAYNSYREYGEVKKKQFIYEMLQRYCQERQRQRSPPSLSPKFWESGGRRGLGQVSGYSKRYSGS